MNNFNITSYFLNHSGVLPAEKQVTKGLEFVLSHFKKDSLWPRTISTKLTGGGQFTVHSKLEALSYFKDSNYLDCRISAYNCESKKTVDFIMIDLDQSDFESKRELNKAKTGTLAKISTTFKIKVKSIPVIWSGKGYHIDIPVDSQGKILEQMTKFKKFTKEPSRDFLRFAEWYLSNGKCDSKHNQTISFNNCMLRIPGSFNSKNNVQVRIIQKGNATEKLPAHLLYDKFLTYLVNQGQNLITKHKSKTHTILSENGNLSQSTSVLQRFYQLRNKTTKNKNRFIPWIERLLKTGIGDDRKYCIWRIHAPYLINVKHLSSEQAFDIVEKWLHKCDKVKPLDFNIDSKVNSILAHVGDYFPIGLEALQKDNKRLYDIVMSL